MASVSLGRLWSCALGGDTDAASGSGMIGKSDTGVAHCTHCTLKIFPPIFFQKFYSSVARKQIQLNCFRKDSIHFSSCLGGQEAICIPGLVVLQLSVPNLLKACRLKSSVLTLCLTLEPFSQQVISCHPNPFSHSRLKASSHNCSELPAC